MSKALWSYQNGSFCFAIEIPFPLIFDGVAIGEFLWYILCDIVKDEFISRLRRSLILLYLPLIKRSWLMKYPARLLWYCVMKTPGKYDILILKSIITRYQLRQATIVWSYYRRNKSLELLKYVNQLKSFIGHLFGSLSCRLGYRNIS